MAESAIGEIGDFAEKKGKKRSGRREIDSRNHLAKVFIVAEKSKWESCHGERGWDRGGRGVKRKCTLWGEGSEC